MIAVFSAITASEKIRIQNGSSALFAFQLVQRSHGSEIILYGLHTHIHPEQCVQAIKYKMAAIR